MKVRLDDKGVLILSPESGAESIALHLWKSCQYGLGSLGESNAERILKAHPQIGQLHIDTAVTW